MVKLSSLRFNYNQHRRSLEWALQRLTEQVLELPLAAGEIPEGWSAPAVSGAALLLATSLRRQLLEQDPTSDESLTSGELGEMAAQLMLWASRERRTGGVSLGESVVPPSARWLEQSVQLPEDRSRLAWGLLQGLVLGLAELDRLLRSEAAFICGQCGEVWDVQLQLSEQNQLILVNGPFAGRGQPLCRRCQQEQEE